MVGVRLSPHLLLMSASPHPMVALLETLRRNKVGLQLLNYLIDLLNRLLTIGFCQT